MKKLFILIALSFGIGAQAQTWTGTAGDDWFTAANWSPATVPVAGSMVTIPGGLTTYPTLTASVTIAGLTMASGSALHLAGYTFVDNGSLSVVGAAIDGGGAFNVNAAGSVEVRLSTVSTTTSILGYLGSSFIYNNTFNGNTNISDDPSQNSGANYIDGNTFNGNLSITHASIVEMDQGYGVPGAGDHVTGNCIINLTGTGSFYLAYYEDFKVDGNLTITRTAAGTTSLYQNIGNSQSAGLSGIGGNFSYTNNAGGNFFLNNNNTAGLSVAGTVNITSGANGSFSMYRVKNNTAGGTISVANATNLSIVRDTLKATTSFSAYTGSAVFYYNSITGNTVIADDPSQNSGTNYIDCNLFAGNLSITHASATAEMDQGYGVAGGGDHVTGNCTVNITGGGSFYMAYYEDLKVDGNLSVTRTAFGLTNLYRNIGGGQSVGNSGIGGSFSYANTAGGDFYLNNNNAGQLPVAGTLNININAAGTFHMYNVKNNTAGGGIAIANSGNPDLRNDTLKAALAITGYTGSFTVYNNSFTGNTTFSDDLSQNSGTNYIDDNLFDGNLSITHASNTSEMDEGYGMAGGGDHVTGNCTISLTGSGSFYAGYNEDLKVDGNLTVNRTASGFTSLYRNIGSGYNAGNSKIGGSFTYTNSAGGDFYLNNSNAAVLPIGGVMNISFSNANIFHMYQTSCKAPGGSIMVSNAASIDLRGDTLSAPLTLSGYTNELFVYDNVFNKAAVITDVATQANGNNYIDGNLFADRFTLVHKSVNASLYEGYGSPAGNGNIVKGLDSIVNFSGAAPLYLGYNHPHRSDSVISLNGVSGMNINTLYFGGSTPGFIRTAGQQELTVSNVALMKTGNATVTLQAPMTINNNLNFTTGYLASTATNPVTFSNNATATGAGNASHIKGPVVKVGNQAFQFPIGNGMYYSPAGISAPALATDAFTAQFYKVQPTLAGYDSSAHDPSINHLSRTEYWTIDRTAGSSDVQVSLGYNLPVSGQVTSMNQLTVAHWYNNGTSLGWHDEGNGGTTGTNTIGTVTSNNTISSFSPFTIASTTTANPLPLTLGSFSAARMNATVLLKWTVLSESNITGFGVQRSTDGKSWDGLGTVASMGTSTVARTYSYTDSHPASGKNFYRIRINDFNGVSRYTDVQMVMMDEAGKDQIQVYPNPVMDVLHISDNAAGLTLSDVAGKVYYQGRGDIDMRLMPSGVYMLRAINAAGVIKFFKVIRK